MVGLPREVATLSGVLEANGLMLGVALMFLLLLNSNSVFSPSSATLVANRGADSDDEKEVERDEGEHEGEYGCGREEKKIRLDGWGMIRRCIYII